MSTLTPGTKPTVSSNGNNDLLIDLRTALGDWINTYASEFSGEEHVKAAHERIADGGGTLAYIATLIARINDTLERSSSETRAFPQAPETDERYNVSDGLLETLIEVAQDNGFRDVVEALRELQVRRGRTSEKAGEQCGHGNKADECPHPHTDVR